MKTAILVTRRMPAETVDNEAYVDACTQQVISQGYILLHQTSWQYYDKLDMTKVIDHLYQVIDVIFVFVDFGADHRITDIVKKYQDKINISLLPKHERYIASLRSILVDVSKKTGISIENLKSRWRFREFVDARYIYFKRAKELLNGSETLNSIGNLVNRDHATVLYGIEQVDNVKELQMQYNTYYQTT